MSKEFHDLQFYDEEIWKLLVDSLATKSRINNIYFFAQFFETLSAINKDPKNPFF